MFGLRAINQIKNNFKKIDYWTIMSHKHANNLVCNEDKLIQQSLNEINKIHKIHKPIIISNNPYDLNEIEWLNKMAIIHANKN